jgi:hypothetical protein
VVVAEVKLMVFEWRSGVSSVSSVLGVEVGNVSGWTFGLSRGSSTGRALHF